MIGDDPKHPKWDPDHRCPLCTKPDGSLLMPDDVPELEGKCNAERWNRIDRTQPILGIHFTGRCKQAPIKGGTRCWHHGGANPQTRAKARERLIAQEIEANAQAVLAKEGIEPVGDPAETLAYVAAESLAFYNALAQRVNSISAIRYKDDKGAEQLRAEVALYERAMDRTSRLLEGLAKLNLTERRVAMSEKVADVLVATIERILDDLDLTDDQRAKAAEVVPLHLVRAAEVGKEATA